MSENSRASRPHLTSKLSAYWFHHLQSMLFSLGKLYKSPTSTLMTIAVIAITLTLPSSFYLFLKNIKHMSGDIRTSTQITLFLDHSATEEQALKFKTELTKQNDIDSVIFLSKTAALKEFKQSSGLAQSIDQLESNPLPHTLIVQPAATADTLAIKTLLAKLKANPLVQVAKLDAEWINRLFSILNIIERAIIIITLLFGFAVLLVVGNTIRLDIQNRAREITVIKLVGATDAYIRRPFLYGGIWYGLLGGLLSWLIVLLTTLLLSSPIQQLSASYQSQIEMMGFSFSEFLLLLISSTVLGLLGSWIAVTRHLNDIEPS
ncbi:MAG: cell division protein FtsX [Gammaproteobacteria bacterium]|nr:cell division protein FtsX [Gammaproteobacteria bacterium]